MTSKIIKHRHAVKMLIKNANYILCQSEPLSILNNGWLMIENGEITDVGDSQSLPMGLYVDHEIDASNCLVIPGFINAHYHSIENYSKGLNDGLPLGLWLEKLFSGDKLDIDDFYSITLLGCLEMLKNGITSVVDHFYGPNLNPAIIDAVLQAYCTSGMRAKIAISYGDYLVKEFDDSTDKAVATKLNNLQHIKELILSCVNNWDRCSNKVGFILGPSAPHRCSPELWNSTRNWAEKFDLGIHTHVLETKYQAKIAGDLFGKSAIEYLDQLGILTPNTSMAHLVWAKKTDLDLMAKKGAIAIHCPFSNLRLGSGIAPITEMLEREIPIAIGSDGSDTNGMHNMFSEMRLATLIQRTRLENYKQWPRPTSIFTMATIGGARSAGLPGLGRILPGMQADVVILDMNTVSFSPVNNLVNQLIFNENGSSIKYVIIEGEIVVENHRVKTFNEDEVLNSISGIHAFSGTISI